MTSPTDAPTSLDRALIERIMAPYKPHCRYLLDAWRERTPAPGCLASYRAEFSIPGSCYIDDTGHFNAVEFNICFNQIYYVATGDAIRSRLLQATRAVGYDEYLRRQLPDVLIHEFKSSFKRPIERSRFTARFHFVEVTDQRRFIIFKTQAIFSDAQGGHAQGRVTYVLIDRTAEPQVEAPAG